MHSKLNRFSALRRIVSGLFGKGFSIGPVLIHRDWKGRTLFAIILKGEFPLTVLPSTTENNYGYEAGLDDFVPGKGLASNASQKLEKIPWTG